MLAQIYSQIDTAIKWVDDRIWGLPLIISDPDNRYLFNRSPWRTSDSASAESTQIHGEK